MTINSSENLGWMLSEPAKGLALIAGRDAVWIASRTGLEDLAALTAFPPQSPLGMALPALLSQMLESGAAEHANGSFSIPYVSFAHLVDQGIDAFEDLIPWSPFVLGIESTGSLTQDSFKYFHKFFLGKQPISVERRGCFIKRGSNLYRLGAQTYELLEAIDAFNGSSPSEKASSQSILRFADIKHLAEGIGAEIDRYLANESVLVPERIGLEIQESDGRITFVPQIAGNIDKSLQEAFIALDDVDPCYTCSTDGGQRVRVVLTEEQREIFRRMQRIRHIGGSERADVLRDPLAVFDGVAEGVDIDWSRLGPRIRGIGDFPFVARPYLQRSSTGIFEDVEADEISTRNSKFSAGLLCTYPDGREARVEFTSHNEMLSFKADVDDALNAGKSQIDFRGASIAVDGSMVRSLSQMVTRLTSGPSQKSGDEQRRFLLIYTNESDVEYEEEVGRDLAENAAAIPDALIPSVQLKDHQRRGLSWLQRNYKMGRRGCLLADDMGLGKTLQTLLFLAWLIENGYLGEPGRSSEEAPWNPILIVAPVILLENEVWTADMRRFFRGDGDIFRPWLTLHGKALRKYRIQNTPGSETTIGEPVLDLQALRQHRVVLTNYETVTNYQHSFARMNEHWTTVITDEAQEFKTPGTKISHALKSLSPRFRLACTGTPVETTLLDVWNIFDFLQPGKLLGSSASFVKRYVRGGESAEGLRDLRQTLKYGAPDAFVLRRNKADVLKDLPEKQEHRLTCDLSDAQREWHLELVGRAKSKLDHPFALIHQLMRLNQHPALVPHYEPVEPKQALAACPKLVELVKVLERVRGRGEKAIIFARSLDMQQILASVLQAQFGRPVDIVNGATSRHGNSQSSQQTRKAIVSRFRESLGFDVLILSPDVAGLGLTLVEANHVFHYGRWWNPAKELQATDRAYRIGQTRTVHVYYLLAKDPRGQFESFDEKLDALIARRRALAADFLAPMPSEEDLGQELVQEILGISVKTETHPPALTDDTIAQLPWDRFEALIAALWSKDANDVILTPRAGDEGVDVIVLNYPTVELIQCKHTSRGGKIDADVIAELIQAFEGYRARRFRDSRRSVLFRMALVTNGSTTKAARQAAKERGVEILEGGDLLRKLLSRRCTSLDVQPMQERRMASMRDVQARVATFCAVQG